jgi:hypothetical protein
MWELNNNSRCLLLPLVRTERALRDSRQQLSSRDLPTRHPNSTLQGVDFFLVQPPHLKWLRSG